MENKENDGDDDFQDSDGNNQSDGGQSNDDMAGIYGNTPPSAGSDMDA